MDAVFQCEKGWQWYTVAYTLELIYFVFYFQKNLENFSTYVNIKDENLIKKTNIGVIPVC